MAESETKCCRILQGPCCFAPVFVFFFVGGGLGDSRGVFIRFAGSRMSRGNLNFGAFKAGGFFCWKHCCDEVIIRNTLVLVVFLVKGNMIRFAIVYMWRNRILYI